MNEARDKARDQAPQLEPTTTEGGAGEHGLAAGALEGSKGGREDSPYGGVEYSGHAPTPRTDRPRCKAIKRNGERCQSFSTQPGGLCYLHANPGAAAEIGRRGGQSKETALRKEVRADDELREKAKTALAEALDGNDEKRRFEAAKSLFSFRAASPPQERALEERQRLGGVYNIGDLTAKALRSKLVSQLVPPEHEPEARELEARLAALLPNEAPAWEPPEEAA